MRSACLRTLKTPALVACFVLPAISIACGGPNAPAETTIAVPNGDFESGASAPWVNYQKVKGNVVSTPVHGGRFALAAPSGAGSVYADVMGLTPDTRYVVSAWVSSSLPGKHARIATWSQDLDVATFGEASPTTEWSPVRHAFTVGQSGTIRVHLFRDEGPEAIFWDDITVTRDAAGK